MTAYKPNDIKDMITSKQIVNVDSDYFTDHLGNVLNVDDMIEQA